MRWSFLLLVLPVLGCATGGAVGGDLSDAPQVRTVMSGSVSPGASGGAYNSTIRYSNDPVLVEEMLEAPEGVVWPLLIEAYRAEGLEPDGADPASGMVTLSRDEWSGTRNGLPLSTFLDCGPSSTGRPLADDARVVASIASQVVAGEDFGISRVTLRLDAVAYPIDASSGQTRSCTTLGTLERDIVNRVRVSLDAGSLRSRAPRDEILADAIPTASPAPAAAREIPVEPGDQVRVWVASSIPLTGSFMGLRPDTLLLLRSRRTALPVWSIQALQVRRTSKASTVIGALIGVAAGVTLAMTTDLGISGSHAVQGDLLNPGLGALAGGLAGAGIGHMFVGNSWEDVPWEVIRQGGSRPGGKEKLP